MPSVVILGIFVADAAYRAERLPRMGETVLGQEFTLGPGGKGSNQAVAAARAGAATTILTRLGEDTFAGIARAVWAEAGVTDGAIVDDGAATGSAFIFLEAGSGNNAIIVAPGAAGRLSAADVAEWGDAIRAADVFVTQLEQPLEAAEAGLRAAREAGAVTILNPAPAADLTDAMLALCDYVTPNESEVEALTGIAVTGPAEAIRAAEALIARGAGRVIVTLGGQGVLYHDGADGHHIPAIAAGPVVDTTGAGDAFTGAFAAALARGDGAVEAARYAVAGASVSVTRHGAATASATDPEIRAALSKGTA